MCLSRFRARRVNSAHGSASGRSWTCNLTFDDANALTFDQANVLQLGSSNAMSFDEANALTFDQVNALPD